MSNPVDYIRITIPTNYEYNDYEVNCPCNPSRPATIRIFVPDLPINKQCKHCGQRFHFDWNTLIKRQESPKNCDKKPITITFAQLGFDTWVKEIPCICWYDCTRERLLYPNPYLLRIRRDRIPGLDACPECGQRYVFVWYESEEAASDGASTR